VKTIGEPDSKKRSTSRVMPGTMALEAAMKAPEDSSRKYRCISITSSADRFGSSFCACLPLNPSISASMLLAFRRRFVLVK